MTPNAPPPALLLDAVGRHALADADPATWLAALMAAGRHLRDPRLTPSETRRVRMAMPYHVRSDAALDAARSLADAYERTAREGLRAAKVGRMRRFMAAAASRDELESLAYALGAAHVLSRWPGAAPVAMPPSLGPETDRLRAVTRALDRMAGDGRTADRILAWGARGRFRRESACEREAPSWLLAMVSPGENPWWLDAVDPLMVAARRAALRTA